MNLKKARALRKQVERMTLSPVTKRSYTKRIGTIRLDEASPRGIYQAMKRDANRAA